MAIVVAGACTANLAATGAPLARVSDGRAPSLAAAAGDGGSRRLADEDCVAGAGWTGFKRAERYAALQHVDPDNANHKRPGDIYGSWHGPANAWVLGTNGTFDGGENAIIE